MTAAAVSAALSIFVGALCGTVYDAVRFFRLLLGADVRSPFGKKGVYRWFAYAWVCLGDLFFFVAAGVLLCVFFFLTGDGRARWYGLAGAGLGFFCYYQTVGRLFIRICELCVAALCRMAKRVAKAPPICALRARYIIYVEKKNAARNAKMQARQRKRRKSCCKN